MNRRALGTVLVASFALMVLASMPGAWAQAPSPSPSLVAGSPAPMTTGTPEQKAAAITAPAVVYIEQYWKAWVKIPANSELYFTGYVNDGLAFEWGTRCSGFVVNPTGYIVTAGHCVDLGEEGARETALENAVQWLADNGYIYQRDFQYWLDEAHLIWRVEGQEAASPPDLEVRVQHGEAVGGAKSGKTLPARVVDSSAWSEGDVALLKVEQSDLPTLLIAPSSEIDIGTPVLSVGYPGSTDTVTDQSLSPTFKDGQINAEKTREGGLLPVYEMSAALSGGMSGGPTVDLSADVVGVNSFGIVGETEAFNFITPGSLVTEMMAQNGVTNELGPIDTAYRAGIDAFFQEDYATAIAKFDEVLALSPTHQQAQEYKVEAAKLQAEQPPPQSTGAATGGDEGGGFPMLAIVGIVVAVLVVAAVVFAMSRRKKTPAMVMAPAMAAPPPAQPISPPVEPVALPPAQPQPLQPAEAGRPVGFQPTPPATAPSATAPPSGTAPPTPPKAEAPTPPPAAPSQEAQEGDHGHFCPNCGHKLETGAFFCPSCGQKIET